jgi:hypothetical protein
MNFLYKAMQMTLQTHFGLPLESMAKKLASHAPKLILLNPNKQFIRLVPIAKCLVAFYR